MRHKKSGRKLNRDSAHRKAMLRNMTASLFRHERLRTTVPKAKELRRHAEPLITLARTDSVANRRRAAVGLGGDAEALGKLFNVLGRNYRGRPGGYLRILKDGFRPGDKAPMAEVSLVDREDFQRDLPSETAPKPEKRRKPEKQEKPQEAIAPPTEQADSAAAAEDEPKKTAPKSEERKSGLFRRLFSGSKRDRED